MIKTLCFSSVDGSAWIRTQAVLQNIFHRSVPKKESYVPDNTIKERNHSCPTTPQRNPEVKACPTVRQVNRGDCIR